MADDSTKISDTLEVTKDVLAPADGPRENLVSTAVKFLQNSKVNQSPLYQKKAFLERKGLTKEEIDLAVQRAGLTDTEQPPPAHNPLYHPGPFQQALVARPPVQAALPTVWGRARDFATTAVIVTSISYAVYRIFQVYIRPWLLGKAEDDKVRMDRLEKQLEDLQGLNEAMLQVQKTLITIQADIAVMSHQRAIQSAAPAPKSSDGQLLQEVKSEVASLKGLLLSRRQFPPTPQTSPVLPSWQLTESSMSATSNGNSARQSPSSEVIQSDATERLEGTKGDDSINGPEQVHTDSENVSMSDGASQSQTNDLKVKGHCDEGDSGKVKDITDDQLKVDEDMPAIPATS